MVKLEFYITDEDFDRLYSIKKKQGKDDLSGNEFAKELLSDKLYALCPTVKED